MKTKIVYVLVSNRNDYYTEMLQLSLFSLRLYHPKIPVIVVMDEKTHQRLLRIKSPVLSDIIPIVVPIPKEYSDQQRSRYLKTSLRFLVDGDVLYLDTDTVICSPLFNVDSFTGDVCAVLDNHHEGSLEYQSFSYPDDWKSLIGTKQFNSGVLFSKDSDTARSFFLMWHENWKYSASHGCSFDQPAFRRVVHDKGISVQELAGIWNCQVNRPSSMEFQKDAVIMHYQRAGFFVSKVCREIRKAGKVCGEAEALAKSPRSYFAGQTLYLSQMEYTALSPLRRALFDHPVFFTFLSKLAESYSFIVAFLFKVKQRMIRLIKR